MYSYGYFTLLEGNIRHLGCLTRTILRDSRRKKRRVEGRTVTGNRVSVFVLAFIAALLSFCNDIYVDEYFIYICMYLQMCP